eukprot:TRINITY_DN27371_c0_g1_i1.p1 TRINITY_DN27371_c0_g1~~TRINITY_DN27371_c0_g1_i1.p1  ORF type:complete len:318 (-),score=71.91 TRINITY_DN27371_c0_g1_i1:24-950(-)
MGAEDMRDAKRRRYSREPDLEVVVEGHVFRISAYVLMAASDVFAGMLESGMRESKEGQIVLDGKRKEDFSIVMQHLSLSGGAAPPEITEETVQVLLAWADEYQMDGLKERCERFLLSRDFHKPKVVQDGLTSAIRYNLESLRDRCVTSIADSIFVHRGALIEYLHDASVMSVLLPKVYQAVGLQLPEQLADPGKLTVEVLWPLVIRAVEAMYGWRGLEENQAYRKRVRSLETTVTDVLPEAVAYWSCDPDPEGMTLKEVKAAVMPHPKKLDTEEVRDLLNRLCGAGVVEVEDRKYRLGFLQTSWDPEE